MKKKYWINDKNHDYVWYKLIDKEGNVYLDYTLRGTACWSAFYSENYDVSQLDKIFIVAKTSIMGYDEETVIRFTDILNKEGFYCDYLGIDAEKGLFTWEIDFDKHNNNRLSLCSTMNFLRYLWMGNRGFVVDKLLQLIDEDPEIDVFYAMQAAHIHKDYEFQTAEEKNEEAAKLVAYGLYNQRADYGGGHSLKSTSVNTKIISRETWKYNLEHPYAFYKQKGPRWFLNNGWEMEYPQLPEKAKEPVDEDPFRIVVEEDLYKKKVVEPVEVPVGLYQQIKKEDVAKINLIGGKNFLDAVEDVAENLYKNVPKVVPYLEDEIKKPLLEKKKIVKKKSAIPIDAEVKPRRKLKPRNADVNYYNEVPAIIKQPQIKKAVAKKVIKKA